MVGPVGWPSPGRKAGEGYSTGGPRGVDANRVRRHRPHTHPVLVGCWSSWGQSVMAAWQATQRQVGQSAHSATGARAMTAWSQRAGRWGWGVNGGPGWRGAIHLLRDICPFRGVSLRAGVHPWIYAVHGARQRPRTRVPSSDRRIGGPGSPI